MGNTVNVSNITGWIFGLIILAIGIANLLLVHVVPGSLGILFSLLFFPPVDLQLKNRLGVSLPLGGKLILFLIIIWFTLGISDLGEIMGL